ncbi:MAG: hypothetical protein ACOX88_06905 [Christensenellales bacterium]|jgi:hypothetical protein
MGKNLRKQVFSFWIFKEKSEKYFIHPVSRSFYLAPASLEADSSGCLWKEVKAVFKAAFSLRRHDFVQLLLPLVWGQCFA